MNNLHQVQFVFDKSCQIDTMVDMINMALEPYHISIAKENIKWLADSPLSVCTKEDTVKFVSTLGINMAVPFKDILKVQDTPNIVAARKRYETAKVKYDKFYTDSAVVNFKYDFIACPHCSSRLNRKYLSADSICPLCHEDMRKASVLTKLSALKGKIDLYEDLLNLEIKKNVEQGKFEYLDKWLIILYVDQDIPVVRWKDFDFSSDAVATDESASNDSLDDVDSSVDSVVSDSDCEVSNDENEK